MLRTWTVVLVSIGVGVVAFGQTVDDLVSQAQALFPSRYLPENLRAAVDLYERALALAPDRTDLMVQLARLHYELGSCPRTWRRGAASSAGPTCSTQSADWV